VAGAATGKRRRLGVLEAQVSALGERVAAAEWRPSNAPAEPDGPEAEVAGEPDSAQLAERVASVEERIREHAAALLKLSEARDASLDSALGEVRSARDEMVAADKRRAAELDGLAAGLVAQMQEICGDGPRPPLLGDAPGATPGDQVPTIEVDDVEDES